MRDRVEPNNLKATKRPPQSRPYLLGLDVGTLSTKGVLVDQKGQVIARAVAEHDIRHPQPQAMEHDAEEDWWHDSARVIRRLLETSGLTGSSERQGRTAKTAQIAGVCVSGLFPALCPADAQGKPLRNAVLYADPRAAKQVECVASATGVVLKGDEVIPKYLWLQQSEPEIAAATRMLFSAPGYVVYRLTGEFCIDYFSAYRFGGVIDNSRQGWRTDVCAELGICQRILPPICSPLDEVGQITADAERQTGLAQGTPVLAGTTDTFATLVGSGIVAQGEAMIYYGTTGLLTVCSQDLERVLARPDLVDDETPFVLAAYLLNFGEALEWFGEELLAQREQCAGGPLYAGLEAGAARLPAGSEGLMVLPHFAGRVLPHVDPHARGSFIGLSTRHSRSHLWRALLESFGFGIRQAQLGLEQRGLQLRRVVASGGGARSTLWRQIVTDITGLPQEYVQDGDTARGAAFLVGYALGLADSLAAIRDCWLHAAQVTQPQPQEHERYKRLFAVYQALDMCLGPHYKTLAEASRFDLPGIN